MAHDIGCERTFRLFSYAASFADKGMAVLLFDYRCFGDSEGEPRHLVHPRQHLQDLQAAIDHARSLSSVDASRIGLWGSSYGGCHVLLTAAEDHAITAIVCQVPVVDSMKYLKSLGLGFLFKAMIHGLRDVLRMVTRRSAHYIPLIGKPGEFALLNSPDSYEVYMSLVPEGSAWENKIPARLALIPPPRPIKSAEKVTCPALIVIAEKDSLIPAALLEDMADKMPVGEVVKHPIGHFDIYTGKEFDDVVATQATFLKRHLTGKGQLHG